MESVKSFFVTFIPTDSPVLNDLSYREAILVKLIYFQMENVLHLIELETKDFM